MKILVVEDETLVRLGLCELLKLNPAYDIVGQAEDGIHAVDVLMSVPSDVVLMDVRLPGKSGVDVLKEVRDKGLTTPIILVTTFDDDETFFRAIQAGANGFLRKDSSLAELTSCIDKVMNGERVFRPSVTRTARSGLEALQPKFESLDLPEPLTKKEAEVLSLMTAGLSNKEIAESLGVTEATIKTHASTIFAKLGVRDRVRAVLKGLEIGYI
ncbi:response regulator transcription factor [Acidipila rosea]|uniref:LuxR family two component transcriptional regulator n=1 Tax=Acidipila rosea TaxID=768535 RepID=A0A4R1L1M6_9BACT|nr:response regulator transcription factor [Acidipila rosea]TCK71862.1 LuxR family two component transcriptional regulator [Acidipila rosea]